MIDTDRLSVQMSEYLNTFNDDNIMRALTLSGFLAYLRKRQKEDIDAKKDEPRSQTLSNLRYFERNRTGDCL